MADWSPAIANEFIRRAREDGRGLTQMQLQKLVYISHGWQLAIHNAPLTLDGPEAWDYGPVFKELRTALRHYGSSPVSNEIRNCDFIAGSFSDAPESVAVAALSNEERDVINRVYRDYGQFHAYKLSALTHQDGTPWTRIYDRGNGRFDEIPAEMIREHFVDIARGRAAANA